MKTILVVDDEVKIAELVQSYLESAGYRVVCAYDGEQALSLFDKFAPSLVVLDLMLPRISGEEVCKEIRRRSRTPIIMLTAKSAEESIVAGLSGGADDYVVKPFSPRQLMARVEAVLRRASLEPLPLCEAFVYNNGDLVIDGARREVRKNGESIALTPTEFSLLLALAKHPTRVFTRDELLQQVFDDGYDGFDRVIDTHVKNLRQKIDTPEKDIRYIKTMHGVGYAFSGGKPL